jgi:hypothetical protein
VKKCAVSSLILLLTSSVFATITNVQSNAKWTCIGSGTSITCAVILTTQPTTTGNLLAVWTFWESTSTYTAAVQDSITTNSFVSAVGPTLQSKFHPAHFAFLNCPLLTA